MEDASLLADERMGAEKSKAPIAVLGQGCLKVMPCPVGGVGGPWRLQS